MSEATPSVTIVQGHGPGPNAHGINVVIDVIRAFTSAHVAFQQGAAGIHCIRDADAARALQRHQPSLLLVGEIDALPIDGFDFGNSPQALAGQPLEGRQLAMRTSNGIRATLEALDARQLFVAGLVNARATAQALRKRCEQSGIRHVQLIASHPDGDEDLACAELMRDILETRSAPLSLETAAQRVRASTNSQKFLDPAQPDFDPQDIDQCARESEHPLLMIVKPTTPYPTIEKA